MRGFDVLFLQHVISAACLIDLGHNTKWQGKKSGAQHKMARKKKARKRQERQGKKHLKTTNGKEKKEPEKTRKNKRARKGRSGQKRR